jgi:hypothetical protein
MKRLAGRNARSSFREGHYPRDYCAMYRRDVILSHGLTFVPGIESITGGYTIAKQLWNNGYETRMIPLTEMAERIVHVAHGTAALAAEKPLHHADAQRKVEKRVQLLFGQPWVQSLRDDVTLDAA